MQQGHKLTKVGQAELAKLEAAERAAARAALAEAEVEYEDRKDPAIDVAFPLLDEDRAKVEKAFKASAAKQVFAVIWTTTPWTIPSNQALNVHPDLTYQLVDTEKGLLVLADELREASLKRYGLEGKVVGETKGKALENIRFRHPFYDRHSPVYLGETVIKRGHITGFEERKGNQIVAFVVAIETDDGRPVATVEHQSVYQLARAQAAG